MLVQTTYTLQRPDLVDTNIAAEADGVAGKIKTLDFRQIMNLVIGGYKHAEVLGASQHDDVDKLIAPRALQKRKG